MERPSTDAELAQLRDLIDRWARSQVDDGVVAGAERDAQEDRWLVRVEGEEKSWIAVWFALRQRALHAETYLMPFPSEQSATCFEFLLRRSAGFNDYRVCVGAEDGIYLTAEVSNKWVDEVVLDRLLGEAVDYTEQVFRPALRAGFPSQFREG